MTFIKALKISLQISGLILWIDNKDKPKCNILLHFSYTIVQGFEKS